MAETEEEACRHALQCKSCELWYCADDEILHCVSCYESMDLCDRCCGFNVMNWKYVCEYCYEAGEKTDKCKICDKFQQVTKKGDMICQNCYQKET